MPYIGKQPVIGEFVELDALTASATDTYTLTRNSAAYYPETVNNLLVSINGVIQAGSTMSLSGNTLTVGATLSSSDVIDFVRVLGNVGNVVTPTDGSVTSAKLDTNIAISGNLDVGSIRASNGTAAMTIDSSGRILQPANPKFSVYQSVAIANADYTSTATSDVPFDTEEFDVGNCVAISSGAATFTAPVTGYYQFNLMVLMNSTAASTTVSSYLDVNGALVNNQSSLSYRNIEDVEGGGYVTLTTSALIYVQATQTVKPKLHVGTDTSVGLGQGQRFSGFLVG